MHEPGQNRIAAPRQTHLTATTDKRQPTDGIWQPVAAAGNRIIMPHQSLSGALTTQSKRDPAGHAENDNRKTHGSHRATGIAQHTSDLVAIRTVGLIALARIGIDSSPAITRTVRAVAGTTFGPSGNRNRIGFGDIRIRLERYGTFAASAGAEKS